MNIFLSFIETYIFIPTAHAQQDKFAKLLGRINEQILNPAIAVLFTVALVLFVIGLYNFFSNRDDTESLEKGKRHMLYGVIGMAIMVSVFGIMNFITGTLGIDNVSPNNSANVSGLTPETVTPQFTD